MESADIRLESISVLSGNRILLSHVCSQLSAAPSAHAGRYGVFRLRCALRVELEWSTCALPAACPNEKLNEMKI